MATRMMKMSLVRAAFAAMVLATAAGAAIAQNTVTLTAAPATAVLPDGQSVPMWGYTCGAVSGTGVSCSGLNGTASGWNPPLIRVPTGPLTITLVNNLKVPTSIVIDGQLGGGLGDAPARMVSPAHAAQGTTWPGSLGGTFGAVDQITAPTAGSGYQVGDVVNISGGGGNGATAHVSTISASGGITGVQVDSPGDAYTSAPSASVTSATGTGAVLSVSLAQQPTFQPPAQVDRVRSFATEVPPSPTTAPTPVALTWSNLRPGTYLLHSGTQPSIQHPMGLYGVLVVTEATANTAYGATFDSDVPLLLSEIDPEQNAAVTTALASATFDERATYAGPGMCKDPATGAPSNTIACYPPAVNYSPRYYLINGTSFDRGNLAASTLAGPGATATTGNVLLRIVNAGLRMHAPSVVGATMTPLAEDGNKVSKATGVQASIPMPPGKTFDALIAPTRSSSTAYAPATYAIFDRQLSLSTNNQRDGGMQAYIAVAGGAASGTGSAASAVTAKANPDAYSVVPGGTLTVGDPSKGLMANDIGVYGVQLDGIAPVGLALNPNGTFTYVADASFASPVTFNYCANGAKTGTANLCTSVTISVATAAAAPTAGPLTFNSLIASRFTSPPPGLFSGVTNTSGLKLTANAPANVANGTVTVNPDGSFVATPSCAAPCSMTFEYSVKNAQGTSSNTAVATVNFVKGSGLTVTVQDGPTSQPLSDYRWIIEEDRTFWIDPKCQVNSTDPAVRPASCPPLPVESFGYNFHSASMPVIAAGCVGSVSCEAGQTLQGAPAACDVGNGACRTDATQKTPVNPADVYLDPNKRYFLSILPGDAINPTIAGTGMAPKDCGTFSTDPNSKTGANWQLYDPGTGTSGSCGHEMGGVQLPPGTTAATVNLQQIPLPTAKISVFVFQDDNPLNGENDAGGGVDIVAPIEAGLGGFELKLFDQAGQLGDATGQITYDEFNMPVSNSLAGYIDPLTGLDACPITVRKDGLVGMIPTCPKYESDGVTASPLAGQAVIANLYPGLYEIQAFPAADRIARGEQWLQTNTLDGGKPHEAFIKPNEPGYFQEFGPGGFHVAIGFANPAIINARKAGYCASTLNTDPTTKTNLGCNNTLVVEVTNNHMSRTPDQRTFDSETYDHYSFTQCYVSIGLPDADDFALQPCVFAPGTDGKTHATATFTGMPPGTFKIAVFDQWNDIMLDGLVGTVEIGAGTTVKKFPVTQWRTNLYTRTYIDTDGSGVSNDNKPGLSLVNTNIRYRDGSIGFFNNTDMNGYAAWNEVFPLMNWLVVETTQTRFKPTWTHSVYDAGGPVDCSAEAKNLDGGVLCSQIAANLANTNVRVPLPADLRVPGAKYCDDADCSTTFNGKSTGALFPPQAFGNTMGWQGLLGQNTFIEFGVKPFKKADGTNPAENGGIHGQVIYSSTRPFDDPSLLLQLSWEPGIPNATVNLYRKEIDAQGNETLKLVDTTQSASWDDWAQGFRKGADGTSLLKAAVGTANEGYVPNMNCPGQANDSPFFATLKNSKMWLDTPDASGNKKALAYQSQFKCYDGWSQLNQAQPAPYDGYYKFPSVTAIDPATGMPAKTNCTACVANPDDGTPMLPSGTYVVEVIVPTGYTLVKEEDKNILMGDVYVAPVTQQFAGVSNIFIMPDQAAVNSAFNAASPGRLNLTTNLGATPRHEGDTGSIESFWPCVGALRQVPDFMAEFPGSQQAAPFAGAMRRLCDRKEVKLTDESSALAKFFLFSDTHIAGHFTGTITNDFASEFDPFSPQFGEKFGPPNLPVGLRDFNGNEVARVVSDQWGLYNGLYFSTWSPNPPNPTGYAPQMAIACMNDPGPVMINGVQTTDPSYNPAYSNFCYEQPFMPGTTTYMDTPVIPTQAFADGYNLPDTEYPDQTPAIKSVTSSAAQGPWLPGGGGGTITITALGDKTVQNPHFSGPNATTAPYNQKTITRHYGFGAQKGTVMLVPPNNGTPADLTSSATWSDTSITATVPGNLSADFNCMQQRDAMGKPVTPAIQCGQLVITRGDNGKRSIDAITVTIGGTAPWVVTEKGVTPPPTPLNGTPKTVKDYGAAFGRMNLVPGADYQSPIQVAIDSASPGDLILVQPGTYRENLIMWKPVRLQGVGAGAVTVNADAHPAGHMDQWRRQMVCVFGLDVNGVPRVKAGSNVQPTFDPTGQYSCPDDMFLTADHIPFESIIGWDAAGNGNLAQVLQEPTLMGAYEGAGVTVVGRGVRTPANQSPLVPGSEGSFPNGSFYLTDGSAALGNVPVNADDCVVHTGDVAKAGGNYGTSNYRCNPSRIDGLAILNSSQGGGGVFIHGWGHNLEVANTRISANHGTLAGAINLGNGEVPDVYVNDGIECGNTGVNPSLLCPPIYSGFNNPNSAPIPFGFNTNVRIHHNMLWNNASIGDALFTGTPAGAGAVTVSSGSDGYSIDHNWVAGNLSTGDGGGIQHIGVSFNGRIANNVVLFNQSTNPTLPTNGGGIVIESMQDVRVLNGNPCGATGPSDADCPPGLGEGAGYGLVVDANLIYGNSAESGTGGGIALLQVNGKELITFPNDPARWYDVTLTNNIIANNVAGYDGGGVSLRDALKARLINNTIASNDTTASAGVLFKTLGAINSTSAPPNCNSQTDPTLPQDPSCTGRDAPHGPQPSGLVTMAHTQNLREAIAALQPFNITIPVLGTVFTMRINCPAGDFGYVGTNLPLNLGVKDGDCMAFSRPALINDLFWQNRTFHVDLATTNGGTGLQSQQNSVVIFPGDATAPLPAQTATGQCPAGAIYWDIGLRTDDVGPGGVLGANKTLLINNSIMTGTNDKWTSGEVYGNNNKVGGPNPVNAQICNGARVPPELCAAGGNTSLSGAASCLGFNAPPGASETTSTASLFVFSGIHPTATVDEGHNWLNLVYGPLTLAKPGASTPTAGEQMLAVATTAMDNGAYSIPANSPAVGYGVGQATNNHDFFGNPRPTSGAIAIGAVERRYPNVVLVSPNPLAFGNWATGTSNVQTLKVTNNGTVPLTGGATVNSIAAPFTVVSNGCTATLNASASCNIQVQFTPTAVQDYSQDVTIAFGATVEPTLVTLTGTGVAAKATTSVTPNPLTITITRPGITATGIVTLKNTAAAGGAQMTISSVAVTGAGGSGLSAWAFTKEALPGQDKCTGATLAPGGSCTVVVRYSTAANGTHTGTITFTDNGSGGTQTGTLTGVR